MITFWESEEAIRIFAGDDINVAKYYDFDKDFLLELEPCCRRNCYRVEGSFSSGFKADGNVLITATIRYNFCPVAHLLSRDGCTRVRACTGKQYDF
jgi:hypothetical protein